MKPEDRRGSKNQKDRDFSAPNGLMELEERVAERTAELVAANEALKREMAARASSERKVEIGAARYRALIDAMMDGYMLLAADGMILDVNEPYQKMTGFARDDLVGQNIAMVNAVLSPAEIGECLSKLRAQGSLRFDTRHRKMDGKTVDVEVSASQEPIEGGFVVLTIRDITERLVLQRSQRLETVSHLAGGMAHEFNNVLQGVLGFASLLETKAPQDSPQKEYVEQIITGARRGADVVKRMLTFSRKMEHERKKVSAALVIGDVVKMARGSLPATVNLIHHYGMDDGMILADRTQIVQVLLNLLINGAHAMGDSGTLTLNAVDCHPGAADPHGDVDAGCRQCPFRERHARRVCVAVGDSGHGIAPALQNKVFEPFFTTKEAGVGTGLGLSVALGIVQENGGHILFRSEVGKGTVFYTSFPAVASAEAAAEPLTAALPGLEAGAETTPTPRGGGAVFIDNEKFITSMAKIYRILFIDDEKIITSMAEIFLESAGFEVEAFNDHTAALEVFMLDPARFHLVVTDQTMRGATGMEIAAKIKAVRPAIPIIMITGYHGNLTATKAKEAGINQILYKPVVPRDLALAIRKELDAEG